MKNSVLFICLFSIFNLFAQEESKTVDKHFGAAINSSLMGDLWSFTIAPTGFFYINKHQIELGFAFHPFYHSGDRNLGGELNYKYFPNGIDKIFNMYFVTNFTYTNQYWEKKIPNQSTGIPYSYERNTDFLTLTGGYGFQVKFLKNAYVGTNFTLGVTTFSRRVDSSTSTSYRIPMFGEYYLDGALRFNVGYRF
ncbi:MAG: hypothetical protein AB8B56_03795 [Crocinitomicaceae bacterium]